MRDPGFFIQEFLCTGKAFICQIEVMEQFTLEETSSPLDLSFKLETAAWSLVLVMF